MKDTTKGLYQKYDVRRTDGSSELGQKHYGCKYFVLDITHDPHALPALKAYADSCRNEYPLLAADLDKIMKKPTIEDVDRRCFQLLNGGDGERTCGEMKKQLIFEFGQEMFYKAAQREANNKSV